MIALVKEYSNKLVEINFKGNCLLGNHFITNLKLIGYKNLNLRILKLGGLDDCNNKLIDLKFIEEIVLMFPNVKCLTIINCKNIGSKELNIIMQKYELEKLSIKKNKYSRCKKIDSEMFRNVTLSNNI